MSFLGPGENCKRYKHIKTPFLDGKNWNLNIEQKSFIGN